MGYILLTCVRGGKKYIRSKPNGTVKQPQAFEYENKLLNFQVEAVTFAHMDIFSALVLYVQELFFSIGTDHMNSGKRMFANS